MKLCILTSHNPRHYYVANTLAKLGTKTLVVSSAMGLNPALKGHHGDPSNSMRAYFERRFSEEKDFLKTDILKVLMYRH